ncbi:MAG: hypothetical protein GVY12_10940 [Bacteroidetes bacterium]|jgi:hypothetical protein|nr:hypothetical protein [Bacteroidota bacterium]
MKTSMRSAIALLLSLAVGVMMTACDSSTLDANNPTVGDNEAPVTLSFSTATSVGQSALMARTVGSALALSDASGSTLTLDRVEIAIGEIEFERDDRDASGRSDIEQGPLLVDLPLDGGPPAVIAEATVPEGLWKEVKFEVEKLERDDDDEAALLDETGFPEGFSIRVEGTWTPSDGPERSFVYLSDLDGEQELEFRPSLEVTGDAPKSVEFIVDIDSWFRTSDGTLINPEEGNEGGQFEDLIEENIERSIEAEGDEANEVDVDGRIEALGSNSLTVNGFTFLVTDRTEVEGEDDRPLSFSDLREGDVVEVEGYRDRNGDLIAYEIEREDDGDDDANEVEVKGSIDSINDPELTVNGITFTVTSETEIEDDDRTLALADLSAGDRVEVEGFRDRDGVLIAEEIEIE